MCMCAELSLSSLNPAHNIFRWPMMFSHAAYRFGSIMGIGNCNILITYDDYYDDDSNNYNNDGCGTRASNMAHVWPCQVLCRSSLSRAAPHTTNTVNGEL